MPAAEEEFQILSPEQRASFDVDGFLAVRKVLSAAEVGRLTVAADAAMERHQPRGGGGLEADPTQVQLRPPMAEHPELLPLVGHGPTVSLVAQLLSPNLHLHTAAILYKHPLEGAAGAGAAERCRMFEAWSACGGGCHCAWPGGAGGEGAGMGMPCTASTLLLLSACPFVLLSRRPHE